MPGFAYLFIKSQLACLSGKRHCKCRVVYSRQPMLTLKIFYSKRSPSTPHHIWLRLWRPRCLRKEVINIHWNSMRWCSESLEILLCWGLSCGISFSCHFLYAQINRIRKAFTNAAFRLQNLACIRLISLLGQKPKPTINYLKEQEMSPLYWKHFHWKSIMSLAYQHK